METILARCFPRTSTLPRVRGHIPELDGIRGWACLSVLIVHCLTGVSADPFWLFEANHYTTWLFLGGVDLFFVLSGFLIGGILLDTKGRQHYFGKFWIRRVGRIFPVAYLMMATFAVAIFVTHHFGITRFDGWLLQEPHAPLWTFAIFWQNIPFAINTMTSGYDGPRWLAMTWSLAIEEQFYMLFPFVVYFLPRKRVVAVVIAGIVLAPILRDILERQFGHWYAPYVLLPSRMDGLLFGVAVALIVRDKAAFALAYRFRLVIDAVGLLILWSILANWQFTWWMGPSGTIFPLKQSLLALMWAIVILRVFTWEGSLFNAIWRNRTLGKLGLISYGAYMYHQTVNGLVHGILFGREPKITSNLELLAGLAVCAIAIGLATLSYIYYERPIRRFAGRLSDSLGSGRATAEAARS
jgi:peptidoglycan/LPS O-acetylase OafA/YrhL